MTLTTYQATALGFACDECRYLKGHRCRLWEVAVKAPADSHCETGQYTEAAAAAHHGRELGTDGYMVSETRAE